MLVERIVVMLVTEEHVSVEGHLEYDKYMHCEHCRMRNSNACSSRESAKIDM